MSSSDPSNVVLNHRENVVSSGDSTVSIGEWTTDSTRLLPQSSNVPNPVPHSVGAASTPNKRLFALANRMVQAEGPENLYQLTVTEARKHLGVDRVLIYQFQSETQGVVAAESLTRAYAPTLGKTLPALSFGRASSQDYSLESVVHFDHASDEAVTPYQAKLLQDFQVQASLSLPIYLGDRVWGLLVAQHCAEPHPWTDGEMGWFYQVSTEFTLCLQTYALESQRQQEAEREQLITTIVNRLRDQSNLQQALRTTVRDIRRLLHADRVGLFQFDPATNYEVGEFVVEDVAHGCVSAMAMKVKDHCFADNQAENYRKGRFWVVDDIQDLNLETCLVDLLSQLQVRASIALPLMKGRELWGLFCVHHCQGARQWQAVEVEFVQRIAAQLNVALQQADYLEQVQEKSRQLEQVAEQERLITKIVERLSKTSDIPQTLKTIVRDIRHMFQADRVGLFQFDPATNYAVGEFVVEDVASDVIAASSNPRIQDHCFAEHQAENYSKGRFWRVEDVEQQEFPDCLVELLAQMQVRASLALPLMKGDILWGIFCIHQCKGPRTWTDAEVSFAHRIAAQLNVALKQADYLEQVKYQSQQLEQIAEQDRLRVEQLQLQVSQLLDAVRPALGGDLTVRAPEMESEVGKIANTFNNTLQSLQTIVLQVQIAADKVGQTSQSSKTSIMALASQAQQQLQGLEQVLARVQTLVSSTEAVADSAQQVEAATQKANQTVRAGDAAMNHTVDGILAIQNTVTKTHKRIQRLSESSQKVSKIVNLISHFTTQTQLLAINASIEATRAGDYGRGFAVVADEVRSLARQSAEAAKDIEQLAQEIQQGTTEVSTVMETGMQQVEEGTERVATARQTLTEMIEATTQISGLMVGITQSTQTQTKEFHAVTQTMAEVAAIANQTSEDSTELATSFKDVLTTAQELQASAGQFKVTDSPHKI